MDLQNLSNEELIQLYEGGSKPSQDLSQLSDEELLGMYNQEQPAPEERLRADKKVNEIGDFIGQYMPGNILKENTPQAVKDYLPIDTIGDHIDSGLSTVNTAITSAGRGIPVVGSFLDEAASYMAPGDTNENRELMRAYARKQDAENPALSTYSKLVSGVGAGMGVGGNVIKSGASLLENAARGGIAAATVGAGHEFGDAEGGFNQRVDAAVDGAKIGGALGAGIPIAGNVLAKPVASLANKAQEAMTGRGIRLPFGQTDDEAANAILLSKIKDSGHTPDEIAADLSRGRDFASRMHSGSYTDLPETIADTSDTMQRLTGSTYRQGDEAGEIVKDTLEARQKGPANPYAPIEGEQKGQIQNIMDAFDRALLIKTSGTARQTEHALMSAQKLEGKKLYDVAFDASEEFDIRDVLKETLEAAKVYPASGKINKSLAKAVKLFVNKKQVINDVRLFDNAKKELDDMIDKARGNKKRELIAFKDRLLEKVHMPDNNGNPTMNMAYKQARDSWGSSAEMREAIDLGRKAFNQESEVSAEVFKSLTPGQQQMFRIGAREGMRKLLGTRRPGNDATLLFQQQRIKELMSEIIPKSRKKSDVFRNRPERFGEYLNRQERMSETRRVALGGSQTAKNSQDDFDLKSGALTQQFQRFMGTPTMSLIGEATSAAMNKILGFRKGVSVKLAKKLMESSHEEQMKILKTLQSKVDANKYGQFLDELDGIMAGLGVAASANQQ